MGADENDYYTEYYTEDDENDDAEDVDSEYAQSFDDEVPSGEESARAKQIQESSAANGSDEFVM